MEDSFAFFIDAPDEHAAQQRGADVAESYVRQLFERDRWEGTLPSWKADRFAHWIEHDPRRQFSEQDLQNFPIITENDPLDFTGWPT